VIGCDSSLDVTRIAGGESFLASSVESAGVRFDVMREDRAAGAEAVVPGGLACIFG
jgi:uncharacterized membrane protein